MSAVLNHTWGVSEAQDRVLALVAGMRSDLVDRRYYMVFQAVVDDSYKEETGIYVLAGAIASAEDWVNFSKDWEELLEWCPADKDGAKHFKWTDMQHSPNLIAYFKAIQRHIIRVFSFSFRLNDYYDAKRRIRLNRKNVDFGILEKHFVYSFPQLMIGFYESVSGENIFSEKLNVVDFIFDSTSDSSIVLAGWQNFVESQPEYRRPFIGEVPIFRDDKKFIPLQAADFLAGYIRSTIEGREFGEEWVWNKAMPYVDITQDVDGMVNFLSRVVDKNRQPDQNLMVYRAPIDPKYLDFCWSP